MFLMRWALIAVFSQDGSTNWASADLGSDERKQKFLRLMGAGKVSLGRRSPKAETSDSAVLVSSRRNTQDALSSGTTSPRHMFAAVRASHSIYPACLSPEEGGVPTLMLLVLQGRRTRRSTSSWRCSTSRGWKESCRAGTGDTVGWVSAR